MTDELPIKVSEAGIYDGNQKLKRTSKFGGFAPEEDAKNVQPSYLITGPVTLNPSKVTKRPEIRFDR